MTRCKYYFQGIITKLYRISFCKKMQGAFIIFKRQTPSFSRKRGSFQYGLFKTMKMEFKTKFIMYPFIAKYMIQVAMRIEQLNRLKLRIFYKVF